MRTNSFYFVILTSLALAILLSGCGKGTGSEFAIYNGALTGGARALVLQDGNLDSFQICVTRIRIEHPDGEAGEALDFDFRPGLIDVSDGLSKKWGALAIPAGMRVGRIKVKVAADKNLCGVDASVIFNGVSTKEEIELKWKFPTPIEVTSLSQGITLPLGQVVSSLLVAFGEGSLTEERMKQAIEAVEEDAEEAHAEVQ